MVRVAIGKGSRESLTHQGRLCWWQGDDETLFVRSNNLLYSLMMRCWKIPRLDDMHNCTQALCESDLMLRVSDSHSIVIFACATFNKHTSLHCDSLSKTGHCLVLQVKHGSVSTRFTKLDHQNTNEWTQSKIGLRRTTSSLFISFHSSHAQGFFLL